MRTICSREIFTKNAGNSRISTQTTISHNFMLYGRLIYMLSMLYVRLTIKVKVGIPESFKVGWYSLKITASTHLKLGRCVGSNSLLTHSMLFKITCNFVQIGENYSNKSLLTNN